MRQINKILFRTNIQSSVYQKKQVPLVYMDLQLNGETQRVEIKLFEHINPETATNFKSVCQGFKNLNGDLVSYKGKRFVNKTKGYFLETEEINDTIYGSGFLSESYSVRFDRPWLVGASKVGNPTDEKSGSGFFVTLHEMPGLDNYVAVGEVVSGHEAFTKADNENLDVIIQDCGVIGTINV